MFKWLKSFSNKSKNSNNPVPVIYDPVVSDLSELILVECRVVVQKNLSRALRQAHP